VARSANARPSAVRHVTLHDIAKRCEVSIATVSAVVNNAEWVSPATRTRVQRAVDEMGYRPNQFARGLKTRRGYAVGVIVSDLTNPFFTEIVRSLSHALGEDGRAHFLCDTDHQSALGESSSRPSARMREVATRTGRVLKSTSVLVVTSLPFLNQS
jgi:DNA-binding LacI/PurR family transcriptional regulator